jgi:hypothetical protein
MMTKLTIILSNPVIANSLKIMEMTMMEEDKVKKKGIINTIPLIYIIML